MKKPLLKKDGKKRSLANLKPIKKGEVRNPKGRPPKPRCIPDILKKIGLEKIDTKDGKITKLEGILRIVYKKAATGDGWAVHFIADRTEGKAIERIVQKNELDELTIE